MTELKAAYEAQSWALRFAIGACTCADLPESRPCEYCDDLREALERRERWPARDVEQEDEQPCDHVPAHYTSSAFLSAHWPALAEIGASTPREHPWAVAAREVLNFLLKREKLLPTIQGGTSKESSDV